MTLSTDRIKHSKNNKSLKILDTLFWSVILRFIQDRLTRKFVISIYKSDWSSTFLLAKTQALKGITSAIPKTNLHIILADIEGCALEPCVESLKIVQKSYGLSNWYIYSDKEGSYQAICYTPVAFKFFMHILLDIKYIDPIFVQYTLARGKASLRFDKKWNRKLKQKLVAIVESYFAPIPEPYEKVIYHTGLRKEGFSIKLGERK
jgi:hypothetical protein